VDIMLAGSPYSLVQRPRKCDKSTDHHSNSDRLDLFHGPCHRTSLYTVPERRTFIMCIRENELQSMIGENRQLVTDEPVEFDK
jgi:hypothetical protein